MTYEVCALYRFVALEDLPVLRARIRAAGEKHDVCGTVLIAPEGINATVAAPEGRLAAFIDFLDETLQITRGEVKYSAAEKKPFTRWKVRLKREIVTLRKPEADPTQQVGTYVEPQDWNDLTNDPEMIVIDTRNTYETGIGMFDGAIDPQTESFTEFCEYLEQNLDPQKNKKVAMYCTGGIRCEKASSYMLAQGFEEVYHLKGGILKYLETISADDSKWRGECFVFDKRVSVGHGLEEGDHKLCYGCRAPLDVEDLKDPSYEPGVSCRHCIGRLTKERAAALRQRHAQINS